MKKFLPESGEFAMNHKTSKIGNSDIGRRKFSKHFATGVGGAASLNQWPFSSMADTSRGSDKQPNILFICSDQHSYNCTGYASHPFVKTPNLDRIARQGVAFNNTYVGSPLCAPGRTCMMTGVFPSDCNSFGNYTVWDGSYPTWGTRLKKAGYYTWATGKIELNPEFPIGFVDGGYDNPHYNNGDITELFRRPVGYRVDERPYVEGGPCKKRDPLDIRALNNALEFIRNKAPDIRRPWAAYVGFRQISQPYTALAKYFHYYYPDRVDMPNVPPHLVENLELTYQQLRRFKRISTPIPDERIRKARAGYYGKITNLDDYVGQLWEELEKTRQLKNTIVIYTADHGDAIGRHGLWGMSNLYEGAVHVPLVIAGAGIPKEKIVDAPVSHVDLIYTILERAGASRPDVLRGHSLLPLIENSKSEIRPKHVYSELNCEGISTGCFLVRKGNWKYMHNVWYDDLLYDLSEDPLEFTNRIDDPSTKNIQKELKETLLSLVDPEDITLRAFHLQARKLEELGYRLTEEELVRTFASRLGSGEARVLANRYASKRH